MVPDGILGAFRSRPGVDELVIGRKRGLMRIAKEEGATVFACWFFGTNDVLSVVKDPCEVMEAASRKTRVAVMAYYGRWGLPVPRRVALTAAVHAVRASKAEAPTAEQVEELHAAVYGGLERVYAEQRGYAGYPDRSLVVR